MQDRTYESPMDRSAEHWTPQAPGVEAEDGLRLGSTQALLEAPAETTGLVQGVSPEQNPHALGGALAADSMRAGELTRGRRRDLEGGLLSLETLKIVYWGPGRSGKTTNVKWLHSRLRPELRGQLIDIDTPGERTLYFDCLPLDLTPPGRAPVQLRLYTVPGQPRFRMTRSLVLDGVDGIVFVWDARSRRLNANLAALIEMRETMAEQGISWSQVPRVVQYNKLDLPDQIPPEQLDHILDRMGERVPRFHAVATRGDGVLDTLSAITSSVIKRHLSRERSERLAAAGL